MFPLFLTLEASYLNSAHEVMLTKPEDVGAVILGEPAADDRCGVQTVVLSCSRRNVRTASRD